METNVNYTVVGLFVLLLSASIIVGGYWLSSRGHNKNYDVYAVYMNEAVSGLNVQAPVKFNGVEVGYVDSITLDPQDPQRVRLLLKIVEDTPVNTSTTATLMAQGITGLSYIGLKATRREAPPLHAEPGQKYPVIAATPSLLFQLDVALREVSTTFQEMSDRVGSLLDKQNLAAVRHTLTNLEHVTRVLADNSEQIDKTLKKTSILAENTAELSKQFPQLSADLQTTMISLRQTSDQLSGAVQSVSQQTLPGVQQLIERVTGVALRLQQLSGELAQNPSILIRGKAPQPLGPGER